jgi:isopentenyldiphosphate isomerase
MDNQNENIEMLPVVDATGKVIGKITREEAHHGSKKLHPVVHLQIIKQGAIYLQKRSESKDIQPGMWDTAVGGHVDYGEDVETALKREAFEELSIKNFSSSFIAKYLWDCEEEREMVFSFMTRDAVNITPNINEISDARFWKFEEIERNIGKGVFTPNFEAEYRFLNNTILPILKKYDV